MSWVEHILARKETASQREQLSQIQGPLYVHNYKNSSVLLLKSPKKPLPHPACIFSNLWLITCGYHIKLFHVYQDL